MVEAVISKKANAKPDVPSSSALNLQFTKALLDPQLEPPSTIIKNSSNGPKKAQKRFDVYRNNVIVSLMDAMKAAYPSILAILGEENFEKVVRIYVVEHPPKSAMMQTYGDDFPAFIEKFTPLKSAPFLSGVAAMEQAWHNSYHASDRSALTAEDFSNFPQETIMNLSFVFHPAAYLQNSQFPILDFFNFRFEIPSEAPELEVGQCVLITRPNLELQMFQLDELNFIFLEKLKSGSPLQEAAEAAFSQDNSFDLASAIALLIQSGAVTSASTNIS